MRVFSSILLLGGSSMAAPEANQFKEQMTVNENLHKRDPYNKLVTLNKMMNRLTAYSKGLNPDDENINQDKSFMNAFKVNNVFFRRNLVRMYYRKDKDGNLKCAVHERKPRVTREAEILEQDGENSEPPLSVNLGITQSDWENYCSIHDEGHNAEDGKCDECCKKSKKTGEYVFDVKQRGFSINLDGNNEDFIKNTRKMFSAVKKWFEIYLGECKQKKIRYNRIVNLLAKRLFNGIVHDKITIEQVRNGRWKRIFAKKAIQEEFLKEGEPFMDKFTLIDMVNKRFENKN